MAMGKKAFKALTLVLAFLVAGLLLQADNLGLANPYGYLPPSPNLQPPSITQISMQKAENASTIQLRFTIIIPDSWTLGDHGPNMNRNVYEIDTQLDNESLTVLSNSNFNYPPIKGNKTLTANFTDMTAGSHVVQIIVYSVSLYNPPPNLPNWLNPERYNSTLTQTVPFAIDQEFNVLMSLPLPNPVLNPPAPSAPAPSAQKLVPSVIWNQTFADTGLSAVNSVIETADGGFMLGALAGPADGNRIELVKVNSLGQLQWRKTCIGSTDTFGRCLVQTRDGGFAVAASPGSRPRRWCRRSATAGWQPGRCPTGPARIR